MAYNEFAYFYDELNSEADYDALYRYVCGELTAHGVTDGIVADFGCGTGELTLMLAQAGYDMIGIDRSEEMLSVLREKAEELGVLPRLLLLRQDLLELDLYGTIRAAVSTFDTYNHIGPLPRFEEALRKAAYFMEKDGVFLFDLNTPININPYWQTGPLTLKPRTPPAIGPTAMTSKPGAWTLPLTLTTLKPASISARRSASTATRWTPSAPCCADTGWSLSELPTARISDPCARTRPGGSSRR